MVMRGELDEDEIRFPPFRKVRSTMKRIFLLLIAAAAAFSITACSGSNGSSQSPSSAVNAASPAADAPSSSTVPSEPSEPSLSSKGESVEENEELEGEGGSGSNILIAYFTAAENSGVDAIASASFTTINGTAVGRLRAVADMIQAETGGELFSIQTSTVYPADGGELIEYASQEQADNARPELTTHIENLDQYDVIFVGFPTWWYDLPQVLYSFFDEYDFSGKTIVPFNVHNGSRFSGTISTIKELEPGAAVIEDGFTVSERTVAEAQADVAQWVEGLGYAK